MAAKRGAWRNLASAFAIAALAFLVGTSSAMPLAGVSSLSKPDAKKAAVFEWHDLQPMTYARASSASVVLLNGDVMVTGGIGPDGITATTEIFDFELGLWKAGPTMAVERTGHTATLLDDGSVLIAGGVTPEGVTASAETIDSTVSIATALPDMNFARSGHSAVRLSDGKVLVTGGSDWLTGTWTQAEVYDPAARKWLPAGDMLYSRVFFSLHLLGNGSALAVAGDTVGTSELYDPAANSWSGIASMSSKRFSFASTALTDGRILVAGGVLNNNPLASAEIYDPTANAWNSVGDMKEQRASFSMTQLETGAVLAAGSSSALGTLGSSELFYPGNGTWSLTKQMNVSRGSHGQAMLPDGSVMVFGGVSGSTFTSSSEEYSQEAEPTPPAKPCQPIDLAPYVEAAIELPGDSANGLIAKLMAAQAQYEDNNISVCLNGMNAFYNQVKAFAQNGHLTREHAAALYAGYVCVVEGLGGKPKLPIPEMLATDAFSVVLSLEIASFFYEISGQELSDSDV